MVTIFYTIMLAFSLVLSIAYIFLWRKHFDVHITLVYALIPVANLGYLLYSKAESYEAALMAQKIIYIGGCYLLLIIMLIVFSLCHIKLHSLVKVGFMTLSTLVYISVLSIGNSEIFYKKPIIFYTVNGIPNLDKKYGFMHAVFTTMVIGYFALGLIAIIYSLIKKNQVSRRNIYFLFISEAVSIFAYFLGKITNSNVDLVPLSYVCAQLMYLLIINRISLYDVTDAAIDSMVQEGDKGFVSVDFKYRYLGSNHTAREIIPSLKDLTVDKSIKNNATVKDTLIRWLDVFRSDNSRSQFYYEKDDKIYLISISFLFDGHKNRGYHLFITDDTQNQQYIKLIDTFNDELIHEVQEKTAQILEMHDKMILAMATLVESRDNSTGGHIKRTSTAVRILTDEMKKDHFMGLTDQFYRNVTKAAPMHDLGKIAVDDAILRKPGKLTDEEYAVMKSHAAEGAKIVHEILKDTEDNDFHLIAENVAHYHHERYDGSGYPDGLKGDNIPIEARITAIADVYDVLVSKRVYKEKVSFSEASQIILNGMGTQFDKRLEPYFVKARPKLEEYYSSIEC